MAPGRPPTKNPRPGKISKPVKPESDSSQEHDEAEDVSEDSQDTGNLEIKRLAEKMRRSAKKRREARRENIEKDFMKQCVKMEKKIEKSFGQIRRSNTADSRLKQLSSLLEKRYSIEEQIITHLTRLERAYINANQELSLVLKGRTQDILRLSSAADHI